jgi:hypothetical protein
VSELERRAVIDELTILIDGMERYFIPQDGLPAVLRFLRNRRATLVAALESTCTCSLDCNRPHCSDMGATFHVHGDEDDCPQHGRIGSAQ